ncbi:MAG: class I SAM-dependent methyltransferase [Pseudomonadota bacterium]
MTFLHKLGRVRARLARNKFVRLPQGSSELKRLIESPLRNERYGVWSDGTLAEHSDAVKAIHGDFMEIGTAYGKTFNRVARIAHAQGKLAHAVDSFQGMAPPGEHDRTDEHGAHFKGKFAVGGAEGFCRLIDAYGVPRDHYRTHEGWIPDVFATMPQDLALSFAIIDVDHYAPTRDALDWVWPRMSPGGRMLLDDCGLYWDRESTRAIKEFLAERTGYWIVRYENNQLVLRKDA